MGSEYKIVWWLGVLKTWDKEFAVQNRNFPVTAHKLTQEIVVNFGRVTYRIMKTLQFQSQEKKKSNPFSIESLLYGSAKRDTDHAQQLNRKLMGATHQPNIGLG